MQYSDTFIRIYSGLKHATPVKAFHLQGEAYSAYLLGKITYSEYCVLYYGSEFILRGCYG